MFSQRYVLYNWIGVMYNIHIRDSLHKFSAISIEDVKQTISLKSAHNFYSFNEINGIQAVRGHSGIVIAKSPSLFNFHSKNVRHRHYFHLSCEKNDYTLR